ncbi:hypothetical protein VHUM_00724 [Vanrija humicola]|uniref:Uncharacterized protein n=1 Tax=Vanrija humicola TaxID=5417 RepID=A0A7D8ZWN5_VANHU|nr:hypothetical protein VHUM_00724 [Vanrija humicola]
MYRLARPTLNALKAPVGQRNFAKATLLGRLGSAPSVHETQDGRKFVTYNLAVPKPPKRDADGKCFADPPVPVRDTNWFTVFNFIPNSVEYLTALQPGTQLLVEANLESRSSTDEAGNYQKDLFLRELSHKIVSKKK